MVNEVVDRIDNAENEMFEILKANKEQSYMKKQNEAIEKRSGKKFFEFDQKNNQYTFTEASNTPKIHEVLKYFFKDDENVYVVTPDDAPGNIRIIENADKDTFEVMENNRYSKDKNNIYYLGNYGIVKLEDVDKVSFVISEQFPFSYDRKNVYYAGKKVNGVTSAGLKVIRRPNEPINFISDNKNLYRLVEIFDENNRELKSVKAVAVKNPKVDFKTFEIFDEWPNYFHDKNNVYYENKLYQIPLKKIEEADRKSFTLLNSEFSKDNKNVYYYGNKMKGINPDGFEFVGRDFKNNEDIIYFLKTKDKVYVLKNKAGKEVYEIVPLNFDANSFKYSNADNSYESESVGYFQDKNGVYYLDENKIKILN